MSAAVTLALFAGLVAAFNPCGFAMLPAYIGFFVGRDEDSNQPASVRVLRAIPVALAVSAGFIVVFGMVGFVIGAINESWESSVQEYSPYATVVIGPLLVALGIAMLFGFELTVRGPKLAVGGGDRGLRSMFLFGVSYAVASISCTLPAFLGAVVTAGTREGTVTGIATVLAYGIGMSLVLTSLTLAVALAREPIVRFMRSGMQYVNRASGALLVVIGAYVAWYGIFSLRVRNDPTAAAGPVDLVEGWSADVEGWIRDIGETRVAVALAVLVGLVSVVVFVGFRSRPDAATSADAAPDTTVDESESPAPVS